jgi:putative flippase GtrA
MNAKKPSRQSARAAKAQPSLVKQGAKFGVVGISNTIIDYTILLTVTALLQVPVDRTYQVKYLSGSIAMINSFYWNRRWVFASQAHVGKSGLRFLVATLVSVYAIQPTMVYLFSGNATGVAFGGFWFDMIHALGVTNLAPNLLTHDWMVKTIAFGMGVVGSAIWNFTLYKFWAFKQD